MSIHGSLFCVFVVQYRECQRRKILVASIRIIKAKSKIKKKKNGKNIHETKNIHGIVSRESNLSIAHCKNRKFIFGGFGFSGSDLPKTVEKSKIFWSKSTNCNKT